MYDWTEQVRIANLTHAQKIMRLVYIDESGVGDPNQEPFTVVAGVVINGDTQWKSFEADLGDMRKDFPQLLEDTELKARDLFWGRCAFQPWDRESRVSLQKELLKLIARHKLPIHAAFVERDFFNGLYPDLGVKPEDQALVMCLSAIETWFCGNAAGEVGTIIADRTQREKDFKDSLRLYRKAKVGYSNAKFNHLIEPILFADSKEAWGIQLADHCAFFIKRSHCMKKTDSEEFCKIIEDNVLKVQSFDKNSPP
jgi:Protein of unknown function (DUF3800)